MLKLLVVEDDVDYVEELRAEVLEPQGRRLDVRTVGDVAAALDALRRFRPDLLLCDMIFPPAPGAAPDMEAGLRIIDEAQRELPGARVVALSSRDRDFAVRLLVSRRIADFLFKDLAWKELRARLEGHFDGVETAKRSSLLQGEEERRRAGREFLAHDPATRALLDRADRVAATDTTVLLLGESGTGKEVLARRIHERSPRAASAFVAVNCGALDENLVGSELFGHVKGAFTGAVEARAGKFELAHGGTLFLDEVGELSSANQVRLLRVLEERSVERVGGTGPIDVDVRLVTATNRDLEAAVRDGSFRGDLLFRLKVFTLVLPPLRSRPLDLRFLAERFVAQLAATHGKRVKGLDEAALARLQAHDWPGNVRELRNALEYAVVLEGGERVGAASLPPLGQGGAAQPLWGPGTTYEAAMAASETAFLQDALRQHGGDTRAAAEAMALPLRTLQGRLQRLGLKARDHRDDGV